MKFKGHEKIITWVRDLTRQYSVSCRLVQTCLHLTRFCQKLEQLHGKMQQTISLKVDIFSIQQAFSKYWVIETWQIMFKYKSIYGRLMPWVAAWHYADNFLLHPSDPLQSVLHAVPCAAHAISHNPSHSRLFAAFETFLCKNKTKYFRLRLSDKAWAWERNFSKCHLFKSCV